MARRPYAVGPHVKERPSQRPILDRPGMPRGVSSLGLALCSLSNSRHFRPYCTALTGSMALALALATPPQRPPTGLAQRKGGKNEAVGWKIRAPVQTCGSFTHL